ncbi:hypothetical protein NL676_014033 [Syzygium grande]|nr:hypothetical protein NL676_014033 [Syzygium grande]
MSDRRGFAPEDRGFIRHYRPSTSARFHAGSKSKLKPPETSPTPQGISRLEEKADHGRRITGNGKFRQ